MGILNPCSWIDDHPQISFGIVKVLGISVCKLLGQPPGMDTSMQFNTDAQREILNLELLLVGASVSEWYSKCTIHSWVSWPYCRKSHKSHHISSLEFKAADFLFPG